MVPFIIMSSKNEVCLSLVLIHVLNLDLPLFCLQNVICHNVCYVYGYAFNTNFIMYANNMNSDQTALEQSDLD